MSSLGKLVAASVAAGVVAAGAAFPAVGAVGLASNKMSDSLAGTSADLIKGDLPGITEVQDSSGEPIAWLYEQQRVEVPSEEISPDMKAAIISIEDRRFADHNGVDWRGTMRALATNVTSGGVEQGASTITQQLIKNYQFLVSAQNDAERRAAIETTPARKIKEIRMALTLDNELSKDDILSKYLNLISFGNGTFGVEVAARSYFGVSAAELNVPQSAMLAGMIQSTSAFDPYIHPEATTERRNIVLDTMVETAAITPAEAEHYQAQPLGVLELPESLPRGCITAGERGFFCDYVMQYLEANGLSRDVIARGRYTIRTTLDEEVHSNVQRALDTYGSPQADGVAEVMSVVHPGRESHKVAAIASSRGYGLDRGSMQTVQPQPYSMVGDGAGSVFKIFTVAAAMEQGMGINRSLPVPTRVEVSGLGEGGARGCPPGMYCVENSGSYSGSLSVTDSLAQSPNTTFINLIDEVGVDNTVDMAVRLGLRSYEDKGYAPDGDSIANYVKRNNLGSFTLGPEPVNALELSNVGATLASDGMWCPPSPIEEITDADGRPVHINEPPCEQVVAPGLANTLLNAMSRDDAPGGTAAEAAGAIGWGGQPMSGKTGTTESFRSAAFLGVTNHYAAATYAYNDGPTTSDMCTAPLRQCSWGNLYGGNEPARTWFSAMLPIANSFGRLELPPTDRDYVAGTSNNSLPNVVGLSQSAATSRLRNAGYEVNTQMIPSSEPYGSVVSVDSGVGLPGGTVTMNVSDGSGGNGGAGGPQVGGAAGGPAGTGDEPIVIDVPGMPPITITPPP